MNVTIVLIVVLNYIFQINERKNVQKFFEMDFGVGVGVEIGRAHVCTPVTRSSR